MIKLRLARRGRKGIPFYFVVASDSRARRDSNFIEKIGTYNPLLESQDGSRFVVKNDRVEYWLSNGAQPTERVANLLYINKLISKEKYIDFVPNVANIGSDTPKKPKKTDKK